MPVLYFQELIFLLVCISKSSSILVDSFYFPQQEIKNISAVLTYLYLEHKKHLGRLAVTKNVLSSLGYFSTISALFDKCVTILLIRFINLVLSSSNVFSVTCSKSATAQQISGLELTHHASLALEDLK